MPSHLEGIDEEHTEDSPDIDPSKKVLGAPDGDEPELIKDVHFRKGKIPSILAPDEPAEAAIKSTRAAHDIAAYFPRGFGSRQKGEYKEEWETPKPPKKSLAKAFEIVSKGKGNADASQQETMDDSAAQQIAEYFKDGFAELPQEALEDEKQAFAKENGYELEWLTDEYLRCPDGKKLFCLTKEGYEKALVDPRAKTPLVHKGS